MLEAQNCPVAAVKRTDNDISCRDISSAMKHRSQECISIEPKKRGSIYFYAEAQTTTVKYWAESHNKQIMKN